MHNAQTYKSALLTWSVLATAPLPVVLQIKQRGPEAPI